MPNVITSRRLLQERLSQLSAQYPLHPLATPSAEASRHIAECHDALRVRTARIAELQARDATREQWMRDALKWMIAMQIESGVTIAGAILDGARAWPADQPFPELIREGFEALGLQVKASK